MEMQRPLFAYFGPETTLPLASVLGAVVGILLMGWHFILGFMKKLVRIFFKTGSNGAATPATHGHPAQVVVIPDEAGGIKGIKDADGSVV
jgi:hypothetical protein